MMPKLGTPSIFPPKDSGQEQERVRNARNDSHQNEKLC
jgi:hypothetical protein